MDRGAWGATVHGVTEKTERLTLSFPSSVLAWESPWTEVPRTLPGPWQTTVLAGEVSALFGMVPLRTSPSSRSSAVPTCRHLAL